MINQIKGTPLLIAAVIAGLLSVQGMKAKSVLEEKAKAQSDVTENIMRWKQSYLALQESRTRWERQYRTEASIQDLMSLYELIGFQQYGLASNMDDLMLTKVDQVTQSDTQIGLTRICMATSGGDGSAMMVYGKDYKSLFEGLKQLAKRPDIHIGNIAVQGDKPQPVALLGDFCVYLRKN